LQHVVESAAGRYEGLTPLFTLLHEARPVLLNFGTPGALDISPWADRVRSIDATVEGTWELPVIGTVEAPAAVLIRPDGHVAWVGDATPAMQEQLNEALAKWFGRPRQREASVT
jgi:3-(3-hydroxy-phenyl)propionate hydroxylase